MSGRPPVAPTLHANIVSPDHPELYAKDFVSWKSWKFQMKVNKVQDAVEIGNKKL